MNRIETKRFAMGLLAIASTRHGWTMRQTARRIGLPNWLMLQFVRGEYTLNLMQAMRAAAAMGVSLFEIVSSAPTSVYVRDRRAKRNALAKSR